MAGRIHIVRNNRSTWIALVKLDTYDGVNAEHEPLAGEHSCDNHNNGGWSVWGAPKLNWRQTVLCNRDLVTQCCADNIRQPCLNSGVRLASFGERREAWMARYRPTKGSYFLGLFDISMCGLTSHSYQNWWHINPFGKDVPLMPLKDPNHLNAMPPDKACAWKCIPMAAHGKSRQGDADSPSR